MKKTERQSAPHGSWQKHGLDGNRTAACRFLRNKSRKISIGEKSMEERGLCKNKEEEEHNSKAPKTGHLPKRRSEWLP